ncbi:MAG: VWA domain-containing protein [Pirellulales bacterium]
MLLRTNLRPKGSKRTGAMLVLVAVTLVIFIVALVFSIDIAYMQLVRSQLRAAADAAAKAGAIKLSMSQDDQAAVQQAIDIAAENIVAGEPMLLAAEDVEIGNSTQQANGAWNFIPGGEPYNAIRVNAERTAGSVAGPVRLFLGGMLGQQTFEPRHVAMASQIDQDVALVLDRSGSMAWDLSGEEWSYPGKFKYPKAYCEPPQPLSRWAAAADAVEAFITAIETTSPIEHLSIVSFSSDYDACKMNVKAATTDSPLSLNYSLARDAMAELSSNPIPGGTNIGAGIDEAVKVLAGNQARKFAQKTMIVMTDGHWTDGANPVDAAQRAADAGIKVHSITFSTNADVALMKEVARVGRGKHFHAPDAQTLKEIYEEIAYTLQIILTE